MNKRREDKERKEESDKRGVYVVPKLKVFGPVGELTQGGSAGANEAGPPNPSKKD